MLAVALHFNLKEVTNETTRVESSLDHFNTCTFVARRAQRPHLEVAYFLKHYPQYPELLF